MKLSHFNTLHLSATRTVVLFKCIYSLYSYGIVVFFIIHSSAVSYIDVQFVGIYRFFYNARQNRNVLLYRGDYTVKVRVRFAFPLRKRKAQTFTSIVVSAVDYNTKRSVIANKYL